MPVTKNCTVQLNRLAVELPPNCRRAEPIAHGQGDTYLFRRDDGAYVWAEHGSVERRYYCGPLSPEVVDRGQDYRFQHVPAEGEFVTSGTLTPGCLIEDLPPELVNHPCVQIDDRIADRVLASLFAANAFRVIRTATPGEVRRAQTRRVTL